MEFVIKALAIIGGRLILAQPNRTVTAVRLVTVAATWLRIDLNMLKR